uniref:BED-type domain-containing protein n=1 Tax=Oryza punctata TaxID=4537 RepID=A0A0E0KVF3_ORYPU
MKIITVDSYDGVTVVPIVGIGGAGAQDMDIPEFLLKILRAIAEACLDDDKLPGALISCGVLQAAAALSLVFFIAPSGVFGHHGKALHWLYYGSLVTVVLVGFVEASVGFWVAGDVVNRRAVGRTSLLICLFSLIFVVAIWGSVLHGTCLYSRSEGKCSKQIYSAFAILAIGHSPRIAPVPMEEVEAGLLEGGIRWLAETILENLDTDKLDEWIRQVGLADDAEKIRSEIERVEVVVAAVKGRAIGNRSLARSLGRLREVLYDADDAIDELDYFRLQHQVEGGVITRFEAEDTVGDGEEDEDDIPMDNTDVPAAAAAGSSSKKRSKVWEHFTPVEFTADGKASKARCNYCDKDLCCTSKNGTSALRNHLKICKKNVGPSDQPPNPSRLAAGNSVHRKRRRTNEESTQHVGAKPWNKADFSNRIQQITCHLQEAMSEILKLHGSDSFTSSSNLCRSSTSESHILTSSLTQRRLYGRVEANLVEGSIGWLVQTILAALMDDKLDAWIRQVGLADDTEKLRSEIESVEVVAADVKGRAIRNRSLARSLVRLRELLYDADDMVDELDYYRLQQQVQGGGASIPLSFGSDEWQGAPVSADEHGVEQTDRPNSNDGTASGSRGKKRSKAWAHFKEENGKPGKARCIHCHTVVKCGSDKGTSVLHNHLKSGSCNKKRQASDQQPNPPSSTAEATANGMPVELGGSGSRKRIRINGESSTQNNARPWNKAEISRRMQQITSELQDVRGAVSEVLNLHGPDSVVCSNHRLITTTDLCRKTSSLNQHEMYGRDAEKNDIMEIITDDSNDRVTVVPIVGIAGVGKTALAQLVYNDPIVKCDFERIWVWVSDNYDELRLTMEILEFVSHEESPQRKESHKGVSSFAKLQEILNGYMDIKSKKFLLVLDDVWDNMVDYRWNTLLAPLKPSRVKGNMILVTTRSLSLAQRMGTVEPIELDALSTEDFLLYFRTCAFGDVDYEAHPSLNIIGQNIADELHGNPLAAETAGWLLRKHLSIDHWSNILKNEDWKSLHISRGIMPSLKLSYDQLPYSLQQCFLYCSIFPSSYCFVSEELICIWISQGFVHCNSSSKRLEEIGRDYLTNLVNSGFFQQVEHTKYTMCGLMHDFARLVSRTEYATIDNLQSNKILPTIRHLSVLTTSAHHEDPSNDKVEGIIRNAVKAVKHLRTLVLIGKHGSLFFQSFKHVVQKGHHLRLLQISETCTDVDPLLCNLVNPAHIRYMKLDNGALPQSFSKFYHLQVLDAGPKSDLIIPNGMDDLVSLRHLVVAEKACSSITSIGKMTSLQELHKFSVQNSSGWEIAQLQSMNQLVQLGVYQLKNVTTRAEACGAKLRDKQNLEKLRLSWTNLDKLGILWTYFLTDLTQDECQNAREVLEGLEPHTNLKHLEIYSYNGATSPTWLATSLTSLQTLRLGCCGQWQILPSLERFPFLRKVELRSMQNILEMTVPSLEELMLIDMPNLERCSCTSMRDLNCSLRVLEIERCPVLKVFPLFEDCQKFEIERKSWLSHLSKLIIHDCPHLHVHNPLPPSTILLELSIVNVSTLPTLEGSSNGTLEVHPPNDDDDDPDKLITLDDNVMSFHNLRFLTGLEIYGWQNPTSISLDGLRQLICLKTLEIHNCPKLVSSNVPSELTCEYMPGANHSALPSLERLHIKKCGITGKWLSLVLQHAQALQELSLDDCEQITGLSIGEEENSQSNLMSAMEDPSLGYPGRDKLLRLPLNLLSSLKRVSITRCNDLTFYGSKEDFAGFTSLEELVIYGCPKLLSSLAHNDGNDEQSNGRWFLPLSLGELEIGHDDSLRTLQPCFPGNLTHLKKLIVKHNRSLTSLQLHFCTALQELIIQSCESLDSLEGMQSLSNLRLLRAHRCLGNHGEDGSCILPQSLEELYINGYSQEKLQPYFPGNLTRLKKLQVLGNLRLASLKLHSCTALQELTIQHCELLNSLEGLQSLGNLRLLPGTTDAS